MFWTVCSTVTIRRSQVGKWRSCTPSPVVSNQSVMQRNATQRNAPYRNVPKRIARERNSYGNNSANEIVVTKAIHFFAFFCTFTDNQTVRNQQQQEAKVIWQRLHRMHYTHCMRRRLGDTDHAHALSASDALSLDAVRNRTVP